MDTREFKQILEHAIQSTDQTVKNAVLSKIVESASMVDVFNNIDQISRIGTIASDQYITTISDIVMENTKVIPYQDAANIFIILKDSYCATTDISTIKDVCMNKEGSFDIVDIENAFEYFVESELCPYMMEYIRFREAATLTSKVHLGALKKICLRITSDRDPMKYGKNLKMLVDFIMTTDKLSDKSKMLAINKIVECVKYVLNIKNMKYFKYCILNELYKILAFYTEDVRHGILLPLLTTVEENGGDDIEEMADIIIPIGIKEYKIYVNSDSFVGDHRELAENEVDEIVILDSDVKESISDMNPSDHVTYSQITLVDPQELQLTNEMIKYYSMEVLKQFSNPNVSIDDTIKLGNVLESLMISEMNPYTEASISKNPVKKIARKISKANDKLIQKSKNFANSENPFKIMGRSAEKWAEFVNKKITEIRKKDSDERRAMILEGSSKTKVKRIFSIAVKSAAAGVAFTPIFGVIALIVSVALDAKATEKEKRALLKDLENEKKIVEEKIRDADSDGNRKAKYQLMRIYDKLDRDIVRIKYNIRDIYSKSNDLGKRRTD